MKWSLAIVLGELQPRIEVGERVVVAREVEPHLGAEAERIRVAGIELEDFSCDLLGVLEVLGDREHAGQREAPFEGVLFARGRAAEREDRAAGLAAADQGGAEEVVRLGVVGLLVDDAAQELDRLGVLLLLTQRARLRDAVFDSAPAAHPDDPDDPGEAQGEKEPPAARGRARGTGHGDSFRWRRLTSATAGAKRTRQYTKVARMRG